MKKGGKKNWQPSSRNGGALRTWIVTREICRRTTRWARFYSNSRVNSGLRPRVCRWSPRSFSKGLAGVTILTRAVKNVGRHKREEKTMHTHDTPFPGQKESSLRGGTLESSSGFSFFPRSLPGHFYDRHSRRRRSWPPSFSRSSNVEDVGISRTNRESGHGARSKQEPAGYYLSNSHALCTYIHSWILRHVDGREPTINHFESVVASGSIWPRQSS